MSGLIPGIPRFEMGLDFHFPDTGSVSFVRKPYAAKWVWTGAERRHAYAGSRLLCSPPPESARVLDKSGSSKQEEDGERFCVLRDSADVKSRPFELVALGYTPYDVSAAHPLHFLRQ
ncbi:hypothetical protein C8R43DRAFT_951535 [Mycena crocata]|nr:hypothetical protein C8R43DRAFT_951535 [Mycena crocata]